MGKLILIIALVTMFSGLFSQAHGKAFIGYSLSTPVTGNVATLRQAWQPDQQICLKTNIYSYV